MTEPLDLDAIERRANAATEGPWETGFSVYRDSSVRTHRTKSSVGIAFFDADAEFIAHARTDVSALIAEVRRLREALAREPGPELSPIDLRSTRPEMNVTLFRTFDIENGEGEEK